MFRNGEKRMTGYVITLRNLYRALTKADYPMPSNQVLPEREKAGLVQTSFLLEMCVPELQCSPTGQILWRNSGARNRTFSSLCNRALRASTYEKYTGEILRQLSPRLIGNQARNFALFLARHSCDHECLMARLNQMTELADRNDHQGREISAFLTRILHEADQLPKCGSGNKKSMAAGYVLAWMFLYAVTDTAFTEIVSRVNEDMEKYSLATLVSAREKKPEDKTVTYYGTARSLAGAQPLPAHRYFGHEDELLDIRDAILTRKKIWIHGIGGIGKTELVRQSLRQCMLEHVISGVCLIQYTQDLAYSINKSFPAYNISSSAEEEKQTVDSILDYLNEKLSNGGVLVIDNMDRADEGDRLILDRLATAPYSVIVTSRMTRAPGFTGFPLRESNPQECLSIYRANLGSVMTAEDRSLFYTLMQNTVLCHPQTVYLLSRTVRSRKLSLPDVLESMQDSSLLVEGRYQTGDLARMYRTLYSMHDLTKDERRLTEFFTLLPMNSYDIEWLENNFCASEGDVKTLAGSLAAAGLLNESDGSYSMHPLVTQCLRKKSLTEKKLVDLFGRMAETQILDWDSFMKVRCNFRYQTEQHRTTCEVFIYLSDMILKQVNDRNLILALYQSYIIMNLSHSLYVRQRTMLHGKLHEALRDELLADKLCMLLDECYAVNPDHAERYIAMGNDILRGQQPFEKFDAFFLIYLAHNLSRTEYTDDSIRFLEAALANTSDPDIQIIGYEHLIEKLYYSAQIQRCHEVVREAYALFEDNDQINAVEKVRLFCHSLNLLLVIRAFDEIGEKIDRYEKYTAETELPIPVRAEVRVLLTTARANLYLSLGKSEKALEVYEAYAGYIRQTAGANQHCYLLIMHMIAMTYRTMGDTASAEKNFEEAIGLINDSTPVMTILILYNNYAVLNLEQNMPEKALELLNKGLELHQEDEDEAPMTEIYRNLGRVFDALGQPDNAMIWWKRAEPLLNMMYGPDHERTQYARNRVKELNSA